MSGRRFALGPPVGGIVHVFFAHCCATIVSGASRPWGITGNDTFFTASVERVRVVTAAATRDHADGE